MLPYFRGMEAFSISLPKSWSELSDQQLRFFFRQVARDLPMNEVLALAFANGLNLLCFVMQTNTPVWSRTGKVNAKWCLPIGKSPLLRNNSRSWRASLPSLYAFLSFAVHRQSLPICKPSPLRTILLARTITKVFCTRKAWNALRRWRICFIRNFRIKLVWRKQNCFLYFIGSLLLKRTSSVCSHT